MSFSYTWKYYYKNGKSIRFEPITWIKGLIHDAFIFFDKNEEYWAINSWMIKVKAKFFPYQVLLHHNGRSQWCYSDPREVMLHAIAECVISQVESRHFAIVDWTATPDHQKSYYAWMHFYNWYKYNRPFRQSPLDNYHGPTMTFEPAGQGCHRILSDPEFSKICELERIYENMYDDEDQEMLKMVLETRLGMWT